MRRALDERWRAEAGAFRWNATTEMAWTDGVTYVMFNEMPRVEDSARFIARAPTRTAT